MSDFHITAHNVRLGDCSRLYTGARVRVAQRGVPIVLVLFV